MTIEPPHEVAQMPGAGSKPEATKGTEPEATAGLELEETAASISSRAQAVSDDAFLGDLVRALQPEKGYRAGVDAVLLAAAAPVQLGRAERVLDAGAGVGVVGLCLAARIRDAKLTMLERVPELAALARQNAARNGWQERIRVVEGDLTGPAASLVQAGLQLESFDHVLANPPFYIEGDGTPALGRLKASSQAMAADDLEHWCRFLAAAAKPGGRLTLIHRAPRLGDVLGSISRRFGALRLLPIYPRQGEPAHRIIVQGVKGSHAPLTLMAGFTLHPGGEAGSPGRSASSKFLPQAEAVLRHGAALAMAADKPALS